MQPVTIRIPDDTHRTLADEADERDASMSEVLREHVEKGMAYDDLEAERDRLQRQLAATNQRVDEHQELVEYVEDELSYREAGLGTRMKWWLFGKGGE